MTWAFQWLGTALDSKLNPKTEHRRLDNIRCFLSGCKLRGGGRFEAAILHLPIGNAYASGDHRWDAMELFAMLEAHETVLLRSRYEDLMSKVRVEFPELKTQFSEQFS
ncbi:MAG: hypothetical protein WBE87_12400 [Candidatus Acidiferrales bacterium]